MRINLEKNQIYGAPKLIMLASAVFLAFLVLNIIFNPQKTQATYDSGRIIDNAVFLNANSMNAAQIQSFLVSKNSGLSTMNFPLQCYGSDSKERQLYTAAGATCDTPIPASQIIYYASQIYGVNPQVILATMQKEQSLTTAPNPTSWQLNQAMGYACPTSGQCGGSSTFAYQIDSGAWALRYHYERANGNTTWWNSATSWTCGTGKPNYYLPNLYPGQNVQFIDPYSNINYATVYIQNAATSAFYCYTPHVYNNHTNSPHPDELKGTSRCYPDSLHPPMGDRGRCYTGSFNFVYFFELWFGSVFANMSVSNIAWNYESLDGTSQSVSQTPGSVGKFTHTTTYNGNLHVFFYDQNGGNLRHAWADSTGWHFETLDGNGGVNGRANANVGGFSKSTVFNNKLYLAYYDFTGQALRLGVLDGSTWSFETLDGNGGQNGRVQGNVGQDIAVGTNGNSVQLFYSDVTDGNLRHAWLTANTWKFEDLDGSTNSLSGYSSFVGQGPSVTNMGSVIQLFYYDQATGNLRHAWADNRGWHFENLDGDPLSVGRYNSNVGLSSSVSYFAGVLQLFYYDHSNGNLRHAWADNKGWHFENLDGDPLSVGRYNSNVGQKPFIIGDYSKNKLHVYYYDVTSKALLQAWSDSGGWHFAVIDGSYTAVSRYQTALDSSASGTMYGNSLQLYYQDLKNNSLRHAWGESN